MRETLQVELRTVGAGRTVVRSRGELDAASAERLHDVAAAAIDGRSPVVILDLRDVTFCDAAGLRALVGLGRRAARLQRTLVLRCSAPIDRVQRLTRVRPYGVAS